MCLKESIFLTWSPRGRRPLMERRQTALCVPAAMQAVCPGRGAGQEPLLALPPTCTSRAEGQAHGSVATVYQVLLSQVRSPLGLAGSSCSCCPLLLQRDLPYPEPDRTGRATEALLQALSKTPQTQQRLPHQCDGRMEAFEGKYPMSWNEPSSQP